MDEARRYDLNQADNGTINEQDVRVIKSLFGRKDESLNVLAQSFLITFKRRCSWSIAVLLVEIYGKISPTSISSDTLIERIVLVYLVFRVAELDGTDIRGSSIAQMGHMFLPFLLNIAEKGTKEERYLAQMLLSNPDLIGQQTPMEIVAESADKQDLDYSPVVRFYAAQSARFPALEEKKDDQSSEEEKELEEIVNRMLSGRILSMPENRKLLHGIINCSDSSHLLQMFEQLNIAALTKLIEENSKVAAEVICRLVKRCTGRVHFYVSVVMQMTLTVHSVEIVLKLYTGTRGLDPDPLRAFVCHCIRCCDEASPSKQSRLVRMICLFISSLLKQDLLQMNELFTELSDFAIRYCHFKETSGLYMSLNGARSKVASS